MLKVHDDLSESNGELTTHRFCAPIFVADEFGLLLGDPTARNELSDTANIRNGTLTFVSVAGHIYGLTCRHVIEELERRKDAKRNENQEKYGIVTPDEVLAKLYVPMGNRHIHVNSKFHVVPGDTFTGHSQDVAIARLSPHLIEVLNKFPVNSCRATLPENLDIEGLCGIATGYPEANRRVAPRNELLNDFHISTMYAYAAFNRLDHSGVRMFGELDQRPDGDNLSGMSGGPIFWSHGDDWGFAGIVYNGRDIIGTEDAQANSFLTNPTIWIDGEAISDEKLKEWIKIIPEDEEFLKDGSKLLYIPEALR